MTRIKPIVQVAYIADPENGSGKNLEQAFAFIFEKALVMAKAKRLANQVKVSYINNNPQKEAIL